MDAPITWGYNGVWVEREETSRFGVSFSLLVGRSDRADHSSPTYKSLPDKDKYFAMAVVFKNNTRVRMRSNYK